jgi:hypothetical protein
MRAPEHKSDAMARRTNWPRHTGDDHRLTARPARSGAVANVGMQGSAEGEHVGLDPGLEERDLERVLLDAAVLTDELVEPRL